MNTKQPLAFTALLACAVLSSGRATVLVDNSFSLGIADGTSLNGVAASATGFSGNYSVSNTTQNGSAASETYSSNGLTFGSNFHDVSGGAAVISVTPAGSSNPAKAIFSGTINATAIGTVYSSYLTDYSAFALSAGNYSSANLLAGDLTTSTNRSSSPGVNYVNRVAVGTDTNVTTSSTSFSPTVNTTYLILSRFTNVGVASSQSIDDLWVFDLASYDNWVSAGADEAQLSSYALISASNTSVVGTYNLNGTFGINLVSGNTSNTTTQYVDEFLVGTTLADVTTGAIPEPSTYAAIAGIVLFGFAALRRRR